MASPLRTSGRQRKSALSGAEPPGLSATSDLAISLQSTEQALEAALLNAGSLVRSLSADRRSLEASSPNASQAKAMEALASLSAAREALVAAHREVVASHRNLREEGPGVQWISVLGTPTVPLVDTLKGGLPLAAADELAREMFPNDESFRDRLVARSTYARRKAKGERSLSGVESDRVVRLSRLWATALKVWGGPDAARSFLSRSHPLLEGRAPIDVALAGELGGRMVEDLLGRLAYGSAA